MQRRTLIRARHLAAFRRELVRLATAGTPHDIRRRAIIVPTRASAELLRQTIEATLPAAGGAVLLPDLVTRDDWMARLHAALPGALPLLTRIEREVILERAARRVAARPRLGRAPFALRPGLVSAMLDFYDELRRRQRTVRRFATVLFAQLQGELGMDRGSESLVHQTSFLGFTFLAYARAVRAANRLDEHVLRDRLLAAQPVLPYDHIVVAVADHPSDPRGLWPADFNLVGRLRHLTQLDVLMTDETHDAGFRARLEEELPDIEERRAEDTPARPPGLEVPAGAADGPRVFVSRDREEELRAVVRVVRDRARQTPGGAVAATAIIFQRPLPYLYLAQQVLAEARVPYQAFDALPLGVEPYAGLLDVVLTVARTGGTRESVIELLRATSLAFTVDEAEIGARDASALAAILADRRATGDASTYSSDVERFVSARPPRGDAVGRARRAARAAAAIGEELSAFRSEPSSSGRVGTIAAFLRRHQRPIEPDSEGSDRLRRARAAVLGVLDDVAAAFRRHDDDPRDPDDLTAAIRHAVEARTFTPRRGDAGVHLVDAMAARFADVDHAHLVGLVETDWPERTRRSIFYTSGLLKSLGWPQEPDQMRAQQAAFRDLLGLARVTTRLHAFQLEGDAIVGSSPLVEAARAWPLHEAEPIEQRAVFDDEVLTQEWPEALALDADRGAWLEARRRRPWLDAPAYSGFVGPQPAQAYRISRVDRYVDCPFKYFAESVLRLPEERDEMSGLTPIERGTLLHALFEKFYQQWQDDGQGPITAGAIPDALARFAQLTHDMLARVPEADRALEGARLLGSIVARGVAERVFELEADAGLPVARRLLEIELKGTFPFPRSTGIASQLGQDRREIAISGKADRIDVFNDGSLRVIDYKLGRLPDVNRSIQIAVYAHAAQTVLEREDGRPHPITAAAYLAFGDERKLEGRLETPGEATRQAVHARVAEFVGAIEQIEAGVFPPRPHKPSECAWCGFAGVCRKEYQVVDDDAAEPV